MTNYTQELDKQIDNTREHADAIRATNPQRATYEDGFADGLGRAYRMVDMQSARIAELEARVKELEAALKAYETEHADNAHDEGVDAGMSFPPENCDCDNCRRARALLETK